MNLFIEPININFQPANIFRIREPFNGTNEKKLPMNFFFESCELIFKYENIFSRKNNYF
jgi:hypothetical protein